jgi:hypothetical protein
VQALHWILRVAFFMDYIGHGAYGFLGKPVFAKYLSVAGIPPEIGIHYLPAIGVHDYILAFGVLFAPTRAFLLWGAIWGLWTALLRPMTGEPWWEVLERGGNYGMPFALFLLAGLPRSPREWFSRVRVWTLPASLERSFAWTLRLSTGFLLVGHGAFGAFMQKELLLKHWASIGVGPTLFGAGNVLPLVGWFEIALGLAVVARPLPVLLYFITGWKLMTELLYPVSGLPPLQPIFEFIERAGSYACPLALGLYLQRRGTKRVGAPRETLAASPA